MSISFGYPLALSLLLLLPLIYWIARSPRSRTTLRRSSRRASLALRLFIATLLILTVADIQISTVSDKMATVFLLDGSDSVGSNGKAQALDFVRQAMGKMGDNQQAGVVVFGQDALVEKLVSNDKTLDDLQSNPTSGYTNVAEAVRLGTALLPSDSQRRLVLLSDGNQNVDDVRNAAKIAAANGVQIDVVPINVQSGHDVSIGSVNAPSTLSEGEQFNVSVNVNSNYAGAGRLLILQEGTVISDNQVNFKKGPNTFVQKLTANKKGFANYTAKIITSGDTVEQNNEGSAYSVVKGKPKVLLVDGHPDQHEAANLEAALKAGSVDNDTITPDKFPSLTNLTQYDSVILVDVPANLLGKNAMDILQAYVRDLGKGLVVVGGEESYALGGYFRTPLEEMLPVELHLPSKLETPSVAMVLVIDRSGSMQDNYKGSVKIEMAKDAAYQAAAQLSNSDEVGVVSFDTDHNWNVNLAPMGNPANLVSPIGRIAPGGGTRIISGLDPAVKALETVDAKNKQIILLTDGEDSEPNLDYKGLFAEAAKNNINISTVGLGDDVNSSFLKNMADKNNGRYYYVDDPTTLPKIFAKEVHLVSRSYVVEENFTPQIAAPSPILKGIAAVPQLKGYVGTRAKATATTALVSDRGDPLLAHWQYGLGRVVAWTSDAKGRWATNWLGWDGFSQFWAQTARWTIPQSDAAGLQVRTQTVGNKIVIQADALNADSQYLNGLEVKASIVTSNLSGQQDAIVLQQTAPGHYEAYFTPKQPGSYLVNVQALGQDSASKTGGDVALTQMIGAVQNYSPEYRQLGTNTALLDEVANLTGGQTLTKPEQAFLNNLTRTTRSQDLWPWLLLLAILLFPLDVGVRRITFSLKRLRAGFASSRKLQPALAGGGAPAPPSEVGRLFEAKSRASKRRGEANPAASNSSVAPSAPNPVQVGEVSVMPPTQNIPADKPKISHAAVTESYVEYIQPVSVAHDIVRGHVEVGPSDTPATTSSKDSPVQPGTAYGEIASRFHRFGSAIDPARFNNTQPVPTIQPISERNVNSEKIVAVPATHVHTTASQAQVAPGVVSKAEPVVAASTAAKTKDKAKEAKDNQEEGDLTSRLLKAKQRAREDRRPKI